MSASKSTETTRPHLYAKYYAGLHDRGEHHARNKHEGGLDLQPARLPSKETRRLESAFLRQFIRRLPRTI